MTRTVTDEDIISFAKLTGDSNPIHLDENYARNTRFGRRIAHGALSVGLISAVLGNILPGPGTIFLSHEIKFVAPVYIGDRITAVVEILELNREKKTISLKTECSNQEGRIVVTGKALVLFEPSH
ncbi:MAG: MaoC family dehydratase [Thermoplasmatota archaeon]